MTALAANSTPWKGRHPLAGTSNEIIGNAKTIYQGSAIALYGPTHGTTALRGLIGPWTGASGEFFLGYSAAGPITGNATEVITNMGPQAGVQTEDSVMESVVVAGLASSSFQADRLKYVYLADDNIGASLTLTRPSAPNHNPVGMVWHGVSATKCDVYMFGARTQLILAMTGGVIDERVIGTIGASGTALLGAWIAPYHGKIVGAYLLCGRAPTDADVDISASIAIAGTPTTGGVMTILHGDAAGDKKSGTAITAANEFHAGDAITVAGTVNTAGTATDVGTYTVIAKIERQIGL